MSDALRLRRLLSALRIDLKGDEAQFVDERIFELQDAVREYLGFEREEAA